MNRLASATSPYLQQHADNPVDWFEWGNEAFAEELRSHLAPSIKFTAVEAHINDKAFSEAVIEGFLALIGEQRLPRYEKGVDASRRVGCDDSESSIER